MFKFETYFAPTLVSVIQRRVRTFSTDMKYLVLGDVEVQHYREEGDECRDGPDQQQEDGDRPEDDGDDN